MIDDKYNYKIPASYKELMCSGFNDFLKANIARDIGLSVVDKLDLLDIDNFDKDVSALIKINLSTEDNEKRVGKNFLIRCEINKCQEFEPKYIPRRDEITCGSKYYDGDKLTWKERVVAFFTGRLYGGSISYKEKKYRWK